MKESKTNCLPIIACRAQPRLADNVSFAPPPEGSLRLFRFSGIQVYLHWTWFLVAGYSVTNRQGYYSSIAWNVAEYLALFLIVLIHEFGHSLACRSVGGVADRIVLWPLGGVAYVNAPRRPGATLWSIAAGPLVNVVLIPVLFGAHLLAQQTGMLDGNPDLHRFLLTLRTINFWLLVFNLLPIFPLDGGQILQSLLWFGVGETKSLLIATVIGFVGAAGLALYAFAQRSIWMGVMVFFLFSNCLASFNYARARLAQEREGGGRGPAA